jgi:predicted transcriptional regulator
VYDFVGGKAYWLASARPTVRDSDEPARVMSAMERQPPMCHIDATLEHAIDALDPWDGWQQCVVVNDAGVVMGLVSRDSGGSSRPLVDAMFAGPSTIRPDIPLDEALDAMRKRNVDERVVTDPTGRLLGVLRLPAD